jgi:hypothetical protein
MYVELGGSIFVGASPSARLIITSFLPRRVFAFIRDLSPQSN